MSEHWCFLLKRYGEEVSSPPISALNDAVIELFQETLPGMAETDYAEHGTAHLRYGHDNGPMYVVELTRHGTAKLEEWADQDYEKELCPAKTISVNKEQAIKLWSLLASGNISDVREAFRSAS